MKKLIAMFAVALVAASAFAVTVTNRGQVITIQTLEDTIADTDDASIVTKMSDGTILDTNSTVTTTIYTPDAIGQHLVGTVNDLLFVATGFTTNDWDQVSPFGPQTAAVVAPETTVPRAIGDILIGTTSNYVWIAKGATTNDWIRLDD